MSKIFITAGIVLGFSAIGGMASADFKAMDLPVPVAGNQFYGATLGEAFTVNAPIFVTSLGAFDASAHTLNGTLVTTIYNATTQTAVAGLSSTFTAASPGVLSGSYLFKSIAGPGIALSPGNYVVAITSLTDNDQLGAGSALTPPIYDNGGGLITINQTQIQYNEQSNPAYCEVDRFPGNGSATQFLYGGSFTFTANTSATPEPGTVALFSGMVLAGSTLLRRSKLRRKTK